MLKQIEGIIFDMDGTLIDSMWLWKEIDIEYLGKHQVPMPDNLQSEIEGMSFTETACYFKERFGIPESVEEIKQSWIGMAKEKYLNEVPMKEGAMEFLKYIRSLGIKTGIATSNARDLTEDIIGAHRLEEYFDSIVTACEVQAGKPAPDIYLRAAALMGVEPEKCLVFEDIPNGIMAGKRAGMRVCGVADPYSVHMEVEKKALSDYYMESYTSLLQEIDGVLA